MCITATDLVDLITVTASYQTDILVTLSGCPLAGAYQVGMTSEDILVTLSGCPLAVTCQVEVTAEDILVTLSKCPLAVTCQVEVSTEDILVTLEDNDQQDLKTKQYTKQVPPPAPSIPPCHMTARVTWHHPVIVSWFIHETGKDDHWWHFFDTVRLSTGCDMSGGDDHWIHFGVHWRQWSAGSTLSHDTVLLSLAGSYLRHDC